MNRIFSVVGVMVLLSGCSESVGWTGTVGNENGIEVVSNPSEPLVRDDRVSVTELWSVQDSIWEDPSEVHAGSGLVVLVDPPATRIHVLSPAGQKVRSIGKSGQGPGEFLRIRDAFPDGQRLAVLDGGKTSIELLDFEGIYLSSIHLGKVIFGGFPLGQGAFLIRGFLGSSAGYERVAEGVDPVPLDLPEMAPLPEEQGVQCQGLFPWNEGFAQLRGTTPQIEIFDSAGGLREEIRIDLPVERVSETEMETALSTVRGFLAESGLPPELQRRELAAAEERFKVKCRFRQAEIDSSRSILVLMEQNPEEFGAGQAVLHFLTESGVYLARVRFPSRWKAFSVDDGVVFALTSDPVTGLARLTAYSIELPEEVLQEAEEVLEAARNSGTLN